jgi:carboxypeptidase Q
LIRSVGGADYRLPHTGLTDYAPDASKIPAGAVTAEDADLIANLVLQGPVKMKLSLTPQSLPDVESANVIADIKGSEHPEEVIIVSGHLDSWDLGTGAIDDGAGVAVSMEAANLIQKLRLKPRRTIRVIAWMNEENGEAGSKQYAKDHEKEFSTHFAAMLEKAGVPAFSPIQDNRFYFNYHHTAADTLDKIVPKELAENSAVVAVVAYALANMERPLPR